MANNTHLKDLPALTHPLVKQGLDCVRAAEITGSIEASAECERRKRRKRKRAVRW